MTVLNHSLTVFSLPTGHAGSGVVQIPSHQVTKMGQMVILSCDPISGHLYFSWYRQIFGQRLEFLVSFYNGKPLEKSEIFKDQFSVEKPDKSYFTLKIHPTNLEDSAMYFCASSLTTALQNHLQPVHKHSCVYPSQLPAQETEVCLCLLLQLSPNR